MLTRKFDGNRLLATFDSVAAACFANEKRSVSAFSRIEKPAREVHRILYLPIEVKAREFHAKALLAREAARHGIASIIAPIWSFHAWSRVLPPGMVLFKTLNGFDAANMAKWIQHGHLVAVLDEEAFGVGASRSHLLATVDPTAAALADLICAQGSSYAAAFPYPVERMAVTGNMRTKIYSSREGDAVLVCLQSGNINNFGRSFPEMVESSLTIGPSLRGEAGRAWATLLRESVAHEATLIGLVDETIEALAESFPTRRIIVRPHPVEDPATWRFKRPNVTIERRGSMIEALETAATVVFVSGCTTGLDAYLCGRPAVRLGTGGHGISARMHQEACTPAAAVEAVAASSDWVGDLSDHLAAPNLMGPLLQLFEQHAATGKLEAFPVAHAVPREFHRQKFPDTEADELAAVVQSPVKALAWNTFMISP